MNIPPRDFRWLAALLTVWFAAVSCAVGVTHAHAGGSAGHVHGHGWNVTGSPVLPDEPPDGSEPHRHLLLFGLELPGEPLPDTPAGEPGVGLHVVADPPAVDVVASPPPAFASGFVLPMPMTETPPRAFEPSRFPRSPRLSTVALRTVCGVLRA